MKRIFQRRGFVGVSRCAALARLVLIFATSLLLTVPLLAQGYLGPGGLVIFGDRTIRESVTSMAGISSIASGANHVVANRADGSLVCWGNDTFGQCDIPSYIQSQVVGIGAGTNHTIAILSDGTVHCWGDDTYGQCDVPPGIVDPYIVVGGDKFSACLSYEGVITEWGQIAQPPANLGPVITMSAGAAHIAVICQGQFTYSGQVNPVYCWGDDTYGQCDVPSNLPGAIGLACGSYHTVIVGTDFNLHAWGRNDNGQCNVPQNDTTNGFTFWTTNVAAGADFTVGVFIGGGVYSCGANTDNEQSNLPLSAYNGFQTNLHQVYCGHHFTAFLPSTGVVSVYGDSTYGESTVPYNFGNFIAVAAHGNHFVGLQAGGTIACWGNDQSGQCDVPSFGGPTPLGIAAGHDHSLAVMSDGSVQAWGASQFGQTNPPTTTGALTVGAGWNTGFAITNTPSVVEWGDNSLGQLNVPSAFYYSQIDGGFGHTVGLTNTGLVAAWGDNSLGQLNVPANLSGVTQLAAGYAHTLALSNGNVVAWGSDSFGQVDVPTGLSNIVQIAAGANHSVAVNNTGAVTCWGSNGSNQCVVPPGTSQIAKVAAGEAFTVCLPVITMQIPVGYGEPQGFPPVYGTVTVANSAPVGGLSVSLTSNSSAVSVPATVYIPAGSNSAQFLVTPNPVSASTTATITGTLGNFNCQSNFTTVPADATLSFSSQNWVGGRTGNLTATVTLAQPAGWGGDTITFQCSDPNVTVQSTAFIAAGKTHVTVPLTTSQVSSPDPVQIVITVFGESFANTVNILPLQITGLTSNSQVASGQPLTVWVQMNASMPQPVNVVVTGSDPNAFPNATLVVPAMGNSTHLACPTNLSATEVVKLSATLNGSTATDNVTFSGFFKSLTFPSATMYGNQTVNCVLTLSVPAPVGGEQINLAGANCTAPASVTIPAGVATVPIQVTTQNVTTQTQASLKASFGSASTKATTTLLANNVSLALNPNSTLGGSSTPVTGRVTLSAVASAPVVITLMASDSSAVTIPPTVTIVAGTKSVTFPITTSAVSASETDTITATSPTNSSSQGLTILSLLRSVVAGTAAVWYGDCSHTFTVSLNAPAPSGGATVDLMGSGCSAPLSVTVPAGSLSVAFLAVGANVSVATQASVTASIGSTSVSGSATVQQNTVTGITVQPSVFVGGTSSAITGKVFLKSAVAVATVIPLTSGNPSIVSVPATVTVQPGTGYATFTVTSSAVTQNTTVSISTSGTNGPAAANVTVKT